MKKPTNLFLMLFLGCIFHSYSQISKEEIIISKIRNEGFNNSEVMARLSHLTDVYGQRLTGTREYYAAANWISSEMKNIGLENVHFENYCSDCRGWNLKSFNMEMISPNYMHISAYPLAMSKSTNGIISGQVVSIENYQDMNLVKMNFPENLKEKLYY